MSDVLVLVTSSFPIRNDGSEAAGSFVADLVEELSQHIFVRVVAPGRQAMREKWAGRVEVFRFAAPERALSTLKPWRPDDLYWILKVLRGGQIAVDQAVADGSASRLLALWGLPCGEWVRRVARARGIPYSVWVLGSDVWSLGRLPILRTMLARVIQQARRAYADGFQLLRDAQRISGVQVVFLPSARRITEGGVCAPRGQAPYRFLFLGRWHPNKGVDLLLEALAMLSNTDWQRIECIEIQGGGMLEAQVRNGVAALQSMGRPIIAGEFLDKAQAKAAIARADWLLIPSRIESIPVVFSDAMSLGRPVIATPVGDLPRLLTEADCGVLARDVSKEALYAALCEALTISPRLLAPGIQRQAERFDITAIANELGGIYADDNSGSINYK